MNSAMYLVALYQKTKLYTNPSQLKLNSSLRQIIKTKLSLSSPSIIFVTVFVNYSTVNVFCFYEFPDVFFLNSAISALFILF